MAKKVSLRTGDSVGNIVSGEEPIKHGGVNYTPDSSKNPNSIAKRGGEDPAIFPIIDTHCLEPQDANDGSHDGKQDSFSMPPFANGRDMRHRG